jgi:hypothetical protein
VLTTEHPVAAGDYLNPNQHCTMKLATSFNHSATRLLRSREALTDEQIRHVAPSVFADTPHGSRSARYTYALVKPHYDRALSHLVFDPCI